MFRWGIIGVGLVSGAFAIGVDGCKSRASVVSVYSRARGSAEQFAKDFGVGFVADSVQELCASGIDAVYIATPPRYHESYALACIQSGLPVLIEKPFAYDSPSALRIINAARENGVFCMEGLWTRFLPLISRVKTLIDSGVLGELRLFRGDFMGANAPNLEVSQFDPDKGGGALMYRGIYPASLAQYFMGPIDSVSSTVNIGDTGVDEDCSLSLRHKNGAISTIRASLRVGGRNDLEIHGTHGRVFVKGPIMRPHIAYVALEEPRHGRAQATRGRIEVIKSSGFAQKAKQVAIGLPILSRSPGERKIVHYYTGNGFTHEVEAFMAGVSAGLLESEVMPLCDTLEIMEIIDDVRVSHGILEA